MPNFASLLKEEIVRLARKELRGQTEALKRSAGRYRSDIAALKRRVADLERELAAARRGARANGEGAVAAGVARRFSAKGLKTLRQRLDVTATDMSRLLGVSPPTLYNWETGKTRPGGEQLDLIASLRQAGKREARKRLAALDGGTPPSPRRRAEPD